MEIKILTLPFNDNYGGVLQAAALQYYIRGLGYNVSHFKWIPVQQLKKRLGWLLFYAKNRIFPRFLAKRMKGKACLFRSFINANITETQLCFNPYKQSFSDNERWIVGSDQVWRFPNTMGADFWFLGFLPKSLRQRSFSYAASFGDSAWNLSEDWTSKVRDLSNDMQAVSLREKDALGLCKHYLGINSTHVPDPTLLLSAEDYETMAEKSKSNYPKDYCGDYISYYILDMTPEKQQYLQTLSIKLHMPLVNMMYNPLMDSKLILKRPIEQWLDVIKNAKFMVTDSFHGCVFSIIYQTNFVVFNNKKRGASRFVSLLSTLKLENRMVNETDSPTSEIISKESWEEVNALLEKLKKEGKTFIVENINK